MTLDEQIKAVGREIGTKRMTQEKADYEIAAMKAVYETLKRLQAERTAKAAA